MAKLNRKREDIPKQYRWSTEDIFPTDEAWQAQYSEVSALATLFKQHRSMLADNGSALLSCLQARDKISQLGSLVYLYAFLRSDEDTTNGKYTALRDRADAQSAAIGAATSFVEPAILDIPPEKIRAWMEADPELAVYRHYYEDLLRQKAHVLSPETEQLLALASEVTDSPANIFQMLESADMRFGEIQGDDGTVQLTHARYAALMRSNNRETRRRAFEAYNAEFVAHKNTFAASLSAWVKRNAFFAGVRGYASAQQYAMSADNIPGKVYSSLVNTVRANIGLLHRYIAMRKRMLGVDKLEAYDMYAPLVPTANPSVSWETAKEWVLASLEPLGEGYVSVVRRAFNERWIDVYENEGKTSGAYCAAQYGAHPFVLLNYSDTLDDVFTLAHEVGHMMHSYYSSGAQPYIYSSYTTFVAEVASTLNEALLMDYLLKTVEPAARAALINEALQGFSGTIFRQVQFAEFEQRIHEMQASGEALTQEVLAQLYSQLQRDYHGEQLVPDENTPYEWSRIPHFYMGFYVYQYATGKSAAEALALGILQGSPEERAGRVDAYLGFLKSGSSGYSIELLRRAGVDMASPKPVQDACDTFARLLDKMEAF